VSLLDRPRGRTALFTLLYASEGAPIGFIWWALPTLLREADVPVGQITSLTALLVLPWVLKFLWAPVLDALRGPRWGYRAWVATAQVLMGASLIPLVWLDPVADFGSWRMLLLIHAVAAATQDVAIDALAIGTVPAHERGRLNGAMQAGMLVGRSVFGGGVLLVGAWLGRDAIIVALIIWILATLSLLAFARETEGAASTPLVRTPAAMFGALVEIFRLRTTQLGLAFALVSAAAFEATGQLAGPYLVDRDVATSTIGLFFGVLVVSATLVGGLLGGWLSDRWGRERAVGVFLCGVVGTVGLLAGVDAFGGAPSSVLLAILTSMYFCVGLFTVASYALFMDLTDPRLGATQFSTFMAATNGCESWSAFAGGRLVASSGYPLAFAVMSVVSLLSLGLLPLLRRAGQRAKQA
jgi:MFS family permease